MSGTGITPEEAAEWLGQFSPEVITEALVPYMLTGSPRYLVEWPAGLPHDPMWNLIPRHAGVPYECRAAARPDVEPDPPARWSPLRVHVAPAAGNRLMPGVRERTRRVPGDRDMGRPPGPAQ